MFLLLVDRVFSMVILPLISRYYKESIKKLEEILSLAARAVITVVIPICAGGTLLAMPIIRFIFGQGYTSSTPVLQILIWTLAITTIGSIYTQGLIGTGQEKRYAVAMVTGTVSNIILNVIMIPRLGIIGAALATICAELIMFYLMYRVFHRVVKFRLFTFFGKPIFASAIMCAVLYFLRSLNVILLVFIGAVIYTFLLYIMMGITKEDIKVVLGNKE
ncbi:polysaccharide biosynthesis C-terminal domain-containing protein, partial [candidate division WOR-3 bacterium]|nr:polysaccharide biosynthesis C-terminal domain-containing protein [candidate division WOR-3 bacterium]